MFKLVNLLVTSRFSHNLDTLQSANFIKLYFAINIIIDQYEKKIHLPALPLTTKTSWLHHRGLLNKPKLTLCFCPDLLSSSPSLRLSRSPAGGTTGQHLLCF